MQVSIRMQFRTTIEVSALESSC